jgi:hypothetical protein
MQYVQHTASISGPEYLTTVDELKIHLGQDLQRAQILAEQIALLGATPTTAVPDVPEWTLAINHLEPISPHQSLQWYRDGTSRRVWRGSGRKNAKHH